MQSMRKLYSVSLHCWHGMFLLLSPTSALIVYPLGSARLRVRGGGGGSGWGALLTLLSRLKFVQKQI